MTRPPLSISEMSKPIQAKIASKQEVADGDSSAGTPEHNLHVDVVAGDRAKATPSGDAPHPSGDDRLAVYIVADGAAAAHAYVRAHGRSCPNLDCDHEHCQRVRELRREGERRRIAETNPAGLGVCLLTLADEGEIPDRYRVGVFDRQTRKWLVNPFAGTSPWIPLERK